MKLGYYWPVGWKTEGPQDGMCLSVLWDGGKHNGPENRETTVEKKQSLTSITRSAVSDVLRLARVPLLGINPIFISRSYWGN